MYLFNRRSLFIQTPRENHNLSLFRYTQFDRLWINAITYWYVDTFDYMHHGWWWEHTYGFSVGGPIALFLWGWAADYTRRARLSR